MSCYFERSAARAMYNSTSPTYKSRVICGEDFSISFHKKKLLRLRQAWSVGFSILERSKLIMGSLYYEHILPTFGHERVAVVTSDTDSFLLALKGVGEEEALRALSPVMDFSNLPPSHRLHDVSRKKIPGYLKTEVPEARILEVVAVKSKSYAFRTDAGHTKVTAKGVAGAVRRTLPLSAFRSCLTEMTKLELTQHTIASRNHVNRLLKSRKVAFSSFDDKRYQLCSLHTAPYGSSIIDKSLADGVCYLCRTESETRFFA